VCVCVYVGVCMCVCERVCVCVYTHTCVFIYVHVCMNIVLAVVEKEFLLEKEFLNMNMKRMNVERTSTFHVDVEEILLQKEVLLQKEFLLHHCQHNIHTYMLSAC